ncbi:MAG: electron transport complex subunit E [Clostridiaceae bacterium]|mgnify:CR=1 FL=1|jgi:electron transport complex protein RnfE|nr:electron transport complex subunit E [Bacillota bacterium]NLI38030.1 electron transport complex subunit E [Clostridiaceae bacterium]
MAVKSKALTVLANGFLKENPTLRLLLGMCPSLAVTTLAKNGIGMGIAATVVLIGSNVVISLIRKIVPDKVRIPVFITVIAGFVTIVKMLMEAYFPDLNKQLGIFIPLIVVNCIILARAEMFASKNGPLLSALDGLGMGIGFTAALFVIGSVREILGAGTWMGITLTADLFDPATIMILPPGGFLVMGCLIALVNKLSRRKKKASIAGDPEKCAMGCPGCEKAS